MFTQYKRKDWLFVVSQTDLSVSSLPGRPWISRIICDNVSVIKVFLPAALLAVPAVPAPAALAGPAPLLGPRHFGLDPPAGS